MDAQRKQFNALMKQNLDLVTAFAKSNSPVTTGVGTGDTPARSGRLWAHNRTNLKEYPHCKKICTPDPADCFSLAANEDKRPTGWKVPVAP